VAEVWEPAAAFDPPAMPAADCTASASARKTFMAETPAAEPGLVMPESAVDAAPDAILDALPEPLVDAKIDVEASTIAAPVVEFPDAFGSPVVENALVPTGGGATPKLPPGLESRELDTLSEGTLPPLPVLALAVEALLEGGNVCSTPRPPPPSPEVLTEVLDDPPEPDVPAPPGWLPEPARPAS